VKGEGTEETQWHEPTNIFLLREGGKGTTMIPTNFQVNKQMEVSQHGGTLKSSILIVFSIMNHPFWGISNYDPPSMAERMNVFCVCKKKVAH
jgi:hypothetical protein